MSAVVVVGALHLDVVVDAPHLPALDETVVGSGVAYRFGGKGGNQAVAAARLGGSVAMIGCVGTDSFSDILLAALDDAGVDRSGVRRADGPSGMSVAIVEESGEYGAVIVSGVNRVLSDGKMTLPKDTSVLLLQNEIPDAANLAAVRQVSDQARVILNAAPAREVPPGVLERADILVVNRVEAAMLMRSKQDLWHKTVIETRGADGLVLRQPGQDNVVFPPHPVSAVSSHGAGDAFCGALAAELARGTAITDALIFANAAAALFVATPVDDRAGIDAERVSAFLNASQV